MSNTVPWYLKEYKSIIQKGTEKRVLGRIEKILMQESLDRNAHRDTVHLHPSEMAKENWCPRSSYYNIMASEYSDPQSFNFHRLNIFEEGHSIHDKWQRWMWKAGILYGWWLCDFCEHRWEALAPEECPSCRTAEYIRYQEVPVRSEEFRIIGHADGHIKDDNGDALVEIKSVGLGTIKWDAPNLYSAYEKGDIKLDELWKRIKRPLTAHARQIQLYMYCTGIHDAVVIYEWKPTQEVREFHLRFSDDVVSPLLVGAADVIDAIEDEIPPKRPEAATSKSCKFCQFCPFKSHCWEAKT